MVLITNHIAALPIALLLWGLDGYLLLIIARLFLAVIRTGWSRRCTESLAVIADWPVKLVRRGLAVMSRRPTPIWLARALVVLAIVLLRQVVARGLLVAVL
jgi:hypothetical protein